MYFKTHNVFVHLTFAYNTIIIRRASTFNTGYWPHLSWPNSTTMMEPYHHPPLHRRYCTTPRHGSHIHSCFVVRPIGSCRSYIEDGGNFRAGFDKSYAGKNLYFGIREHAMGSILNGIAHHGIFKVSGSTFVVFVHYFRQTIRVASLAELRRVPMTLSELERMDQPISLLRP